ncbi:CGNR zinc finger domain-containing protein [Aeromicrobium stalagmiti]|uniref:CGNR zinc finger domain-containing protein n=1 Tax=Aeromicrobium stalagmiti TaxID=2738988 RepID=UPI001569F99B|nr:CGNR zinc finger domain-containing protein [Aeromicrobium stalagmiti]NRQ49983.1 CGNR zinc finger domain-containing protein [Aeromicrobium stalagmiti]
MNSPPTPPSLLLDLVNSRIVWPDGLRDEIGDEAQARAWLRARGGTGSSEEIAGAREVRTVLVDVLRGNLEREALTPWVEVMRKKAVLEADGMEWVLDVPDRSAVGARAVEEWASLQAANGSRIRPCADPDCQHFLVDRSAANRRKWHSMEACGNRTKARRHYARTKAAVQE